jgi:hypothetical protein
MASSPPSRSPQNSARRRRSSASSRSLAHINVSVQPTQIELMLAEEGVVKTAISIVNGSDDQILWKLQTTEPKKYSVSPTKGVINGGQRGEAEIQLLKLYCDEALQEARQGNAQRSTKFRLQVVRTMGDVSDVAIVGRVRCEVC